MDFKDFRDGLFSLALVILIFSLTSEKMEHKALIKTMSDVLLKKT